MKPLLALLAIAGLCVGAGACGGASTDTHPSSPVSADTGATDSTATTSTSTAAPTADSTKTDADRDADIGAISDDKSNIEALGHEAGAANKRAVTALVKRYYAAALAGRGARACSLLYSTLAEATPEDYGQVPGPLYLRGARTCEAVMKRLFAHFHRLLAVQVPRLGVSHVRLKGRRGSAVLSFAGMPERMISVAREGRVWKIGELLDGELP